MEANKMTLIRVLYVTRPAMFGDDVKGIQQNLNSLNFDCGTVDGYYGSLSATATRSFQSTYGLIVDGAVGDVTWNKMCSEVTLVQKQLNAKEFSCTANGYFGLDTQTAMKNFQSSVGLAQTGIVDATTRTKLFPQSSSLPYIAPIANLGTTPVVQSSPSSSIYNKSCSLSPFGKFYYKEERSRLITRDTSWDSANLIYLDVPVALQNKCANAGLTRIRVNKHVKGTWETVIKRMEKAIQYIDSWDGGTSYARYISGTTSVSKHAWGIAIDINQNQPRYQQGAAKITDTNDKQYKLWEYVFKDLGFTWGNNFTPTSRCDAMHFEITVIK